MVNSTDVQTILDADLLCLIRKYHITKVTTFGRLHLWKLLSSALTRTMHHSRQRVEPAAGQTVVMWTPTLGCFWRKNEKNLFFYMFEFSFSFFICPWKHTDRSFKNKRIILFHHNGSDRFTNRKRLFSGSKIQDFESRRRNEGNCFRNSKK